MIDAHVAQIGAAEKEPPTEATASPRAAASFIKQRLGEFFGSAAASS